MERDYSHHLCPSDGFTEPSLGSPCELCLCPAQDTTHVGHKVREEIRVEGLSKRVYSKLMEDILPTGLFGGRTEIRTFEDDRFLCSTLHCERPRGDRLSGGCESPLVPVSTQTMRLTLYTWESLSIPSVHVLKFAAEQLVPRKSGGGWRVTYMERIVARLPLPGATGSPPPGLQVSGWNRRARHLTVWSKMRE